MTEPRKIGYNDSAIGEEIRTTQDEMTSPGNEIVEATRELSKDTETAIIQNSSQ